LSQIKKDKAMSLEDLKTTIEHGVGSLVAALDVYRVEQVKKAMTGATVCLSAICKPGWSGFF
jgi:hypothetical protein